MSGARPLIRVARRSLLRDRWRALLIVILIGLPVAGITTTALLVSAGVPTAGERATQLIGRADLGAQPEGSGARAGRAELAALLPRGAILEAAWRQSDRVMNAEHRPSIDVLLADIDGLAKGMLTIVEGRAPSATDEVAISAPLASDLGVGMGEALELEVLGTKRVVGLVEDPRSVARDIALTAPQLAEEQVHEPAWLVDLPDGASTEDVANTVASAEVADGSGEPLFQVWSREAAGQAGDWFPLILSMGMLALLATGLVASAAFAVGIRRRQRELGLLGAVGASSGQLAGAVLAEGLVAGSLAVVAGLAAGVGLAWLVGVPLDDIAGHRAGAVDIDPVVLLVAGVVGLAAALIAAMVPAWTAARQPTLLSLSGRRPPSAPARRLLVVGLGLVAIAAACIAVGILLADPEGSLLSTLVLLVGAVASVLGFGACSPWLLERLERPARRLPLAARVALRDTARARTRNGAIVTAVLACVVVTIALATILASGRAHAEASWRPDVALDSLMVRGRETETVGPRVAQALGAVGWGADRWALEDEDLRFELVMPLRSPDEHGDTEASAYIVVGDEHLLTAYHGGSALQAFRDDAVVWLESDSPALAVTGSEARLVRWAGDHAEVVATVPVTVAPYAADRRLAEDEHATSRVVMSEGTAAAVGIPVEPAQGLQYLVRLDHHVTAADVDRADRAAAAVDASTYISSPLMPPDQMLPVRLGLLVASLLAALTVTGIAVALGEAESRPEQRTLLALGAPRGLRRRITGARGLVIVALAGALAIPAGLLPALGVVRQQGYPVALPWPEIAIALVGLPLAALAGGLLLGRPLPEWSARPGPRS